jgi:hemoglobin
MDDRLGPVFAAAGVDWPSHIDRLTDFWSWQLLGERDYAGNPLRAHQPVHVATPFTEAHFERWLELFTGTVDDHFRGPTADLAKARATKMATALRRLLAGGSGEAESSVPGVVLAARRATGVTVRP